MIRRGVSHKVIDDVLVKRDHVSKDARLKGWETRMNNIFWIIGVIVVVIAVLSFLGLRRRLSSTGGGAVRR
jgi:UDP-N-acetylmuramyl pentapeptide phosphotransferase/UDP-N-acetylglucosamine-1-phosphate transferase